MNGQVPRLLQRQSRLDRGFLLNSQSGCSQVSQTGPVGYRRSSESRRNWRAGESEHDEGREVTRGGESAEAGWLS